MKRIVKSFAVMAGTALLTLGLYGCSEANGRSAAPSAASFAVPPAGPSVFQSASLPAAPSVESSVAQSAAAAMPSAPGVSSAGAERMASGEPELPGLDHMRALAGFGGAYTVDKSPVVGCRPGAEADFRAAVQTAGLAGQVKLQVVRYSLAELESLERRASAILGNTADCRVNPELNAVEVFASPGADADRPADDTNWRSEVWRRLEADAALSGAPDAFLIVGPATADALIEWSSDLNADGIRLEMPNRAPDAGGCLPLRLENNSGRSVYVRLDGGDFHLDGDAVIEVRSGEFADVERIPVERLTADGGVCFEVRYGLEREMPEHNQIVWQFGE